MPTLDFKGKQFVWSHHLSVPFRELKVEAGLSLPEAGKTASLDDNLIIHGDNLEALKALLPTHAGKVDCIFIDPPYNTGNEGWCYNDNVRSPLMKEWLKKSGNPVDKEDLERHDKWLCMMWPRLCLLHELLADDGVMFITLDDNEQHRARVVLDEIFQNEDAFYGQIAWQKKYATSNDATGLSTMFDHVLIYRKSKDFERGLVERDISEDQNYKYEDDGGVFRIDNYTCNKTADERPNLYYSVVNPNTGEEIWPKKNRVWAYSKETHQKNVDNNMIWWGVDGKSSVPAYKRYLNKLRGGGGTVPSTWWPHDFAGHTDESKKELRQILGESSSEFFTPKPVRLLSRILEIATNENSIILDSFAGSGTTGHAVLEANRKGGNRKFILVECEEYADTLTAERVRRVIQGYSFKGSQREELLNEKITWSVFEKKHRQLLEKIDGIEALYGHEYDKIKKEIKDGVLTVTGERKIKEKVPGIGGSFTFCRLGEPMDIEHLLSGKSLPAYEALARYVFYTATGRSLDKLPPPSADGFIGETDLYRVHLFYQPDLEWLRSNESALNAQKAEAVAKGNKGGKRAVVFATCKFMSQKDLTPKRIEFCQLPYAIHKILGSE